MSKRRNREINTDNLLKQMTPEIEEMTPEIKEMTPETAPAPKAKCGRFDLIQGDGYTIQPRKTTIVAGGVQYPVVEYVVTVDGEEPRTFGGLRAAHKYLSERFPKTRKGRVAGAPVLAVLRLMRAVEKLTTKRNTEALRNAAQWLRTELESMRAEGVDVDTVVATEDARIANVKAAKAAKE